MPWFGRVLARQGRKAGRPLLGYRHKGDGKRGCKGGIGPKMASDQGGGRP